MVCSGFEPGEVGWIAQTNPLSNGGHLRVVCYSYSEIDSYAFTFSALIGLNF